MPITAATDPVGMLSQRQGPAMTGAGAGGAPNQSAQPPGTNLGQGSPNGPTPEMQQLAQLTQRLLMQQKGTEYASKMIRQLGMQLKSVMKSQFMQSPKAMEKLAKALSHMDAAASELNSSMDSSGPALSSAVADLTMPPEGGQPAPPVRPTAPAYPLANAA